MSPRTQPYRATGRRYHSPALAAMQKGKGPMMSMGDHRRKALKKGKKRRKARARYSSPLHQVLRTRRRVS